MDLDIGAYENATTATASGERPDLNLRCLPAELIISANRTREFRGDKLMTAIIREMWKSAKEDVIDPEYASAASDGDRDGLTLLHQLCRSDQFVYLLQCLFDAGMLSPAAFSTLNGTRGET